MYSFHEHFYNSSHGLLEYAMFQAKKKNVCEYINKFF